MARQKQRRQERRSVPSGVETINFVAWADEDYICARALLLDGFLLQGAVLSNTAIEKYLKAVCLARGVKKDSRANHNVSGLYASLKAKGVPATLSPFSPPRPTMQAATRSSSEAGHIARSVQDRLLRAFSSARREQNCMQAES